MALSILLAENFVCNTPFSSQFKGRADMKTHTFYFSEAEASHIASLLGIAVSELIREKNQDCQSDKEKENLQPLINSASRLQEVFEFRGSGGSQQ